MSWKAIQKFFRDNPRAWMVASAAVFVLIISVWGIWGGFSLQFSRFFAAEPPSFVCDNCGAAKRHGDTVSFSWSASLADSCGASGFINTGGATQGSKSSAPIDACAADASNTVTMDCVYGTEHGRRSVTFAVDKSTCPASGTPAPTSAPGSTPPTSGVPVDPTGACQWRVAPNAPNGGWWCKALNCPLSGNNTGAATPLRLPPVGPASQLAVKLFRGACGSTAISTPYVGCDFVLDATPKSGGQEGYPPKDPLWTCTGPFDLGRDGSDFWDCYNPRGKVTGTAPITCCANTGLSGDCLTFTATNPPGGSIPPSGSTPPSTSSGPSPVTPTPVFPLVVCSPQNQTVALKQIATVSAVGGDGTYEWSLSGSGIQEGGTSTSVDVSYSVSGQKVVRVSSAGQIATCVVTVTGTSGNALSPLTVTKRGVNTVSGNGGDSTAITVNPGEIARFTISITNNGTLPVTGIAIIDTLPIGMSYRPGSATINGQAAGSDFIVSGGLPLGSLEPGANMNIQWSATADATSQLSVGPHQSLPRVTVTAAEVSASSADMSVTVFGSAFAGGTGTGNGGTGNAGGVATGPGEAVTFALIAAAVLTLLYSGYTRSDAFRRREADIVSKDQGPLDFRS